jgi:tRNA pseudouridine38-40 synthase
MYCCRYNKRFGSDGLHEALSWEKQQDAVDRFKEDFIFSDIVRTEVTTRSMFEWMAVLPQHKFEPRHFESDSAPRSPLAKALRNLGKAATAEEEEEEEEEEEKEIIGREQESRRPIEVAAEI